MKYYSLIILFSLPFLYFPNLVSGELQTLGSGNTGNILFETKPEVPGPNQLVSISIESYSTDLNKSEISWFINGKVEKEGVGQKNITIKTGGFGSVSDILVVVKNLNGEIFQHTLSVRPTSLDLIWEAQSYTPPFYKGKALYTYQGTVKIVALPNIINELGSKISSKNLIYTWKVDGTRVEDVSGYGKNYIMFTGSVPLRTAKITVEAQSLDGKYKAQGDLSITPQGAQVIFYEDNPLYGVLYEKALGGNLKLENQEVKIVGIPYFIGTKERNDRAINYEWHLNGRTVNSGSKSGLSFKQQNREQGNARVELEVTNPEKVFQMASGNISLTFGDNLQTGIIQE